MKTDPGPSHFTERMARRGEGTRVSHQPRRVRRQGEGRQHHLPHPLNFSTFASRERSLICQRGPMQPQKTHPDAWSSGGPWHSDFGSPDCLIHSSFSVPSSSASQDLVNFHFSSAQRRRISEVGRSGRALAFSSEGKAKVNLETSKETSKSSRIWQLTYLLS